MPTTEQHGSVELLSNGYILMTLKGDLSADTLRPVLSRMDNFIKALTSQGFPAYILVDADDLEAIKLESRKVGWEWLRTAAYDKVSVHGKSTFVKYFVRMLVKVINCEMRYFNSKQEAIAWLEE